MAEVDLNKWQQKNFEDSTTQVLLNPQWSDRELTTLRLLAMKFQRNAHVWIASSGSSVSANESAKLVALSKESLLNSAKAINQHLQATQKDVWAQVLPLFHVGGLGIEARAYLTGSKVISGLIQNISWDANYFYRILIDCQVTLTALVPTQVYDLVQLQLRCPSHVRAIVVGGGALSDELYQEARKLGWPLLPSFGMTECCSQIATASLESMIAGDRALKILSHLKVQINDSGLIEVSGTSLLTGYAQKIINEDRFTDPKVKGWFTTADCGQVEGSVLIPQGRSEDHVKILGEGVNLSKLDQMLETALMGLRVKNSSQFALIAIPDERAGGKIVLLISDDNVGAKLILDIIRQFDQKVHAYEKIKEHHFVKQIPRTQLGKLQRKKLLDSFISGQ